MDGLDHVSRDAGGRFRPGQSGNPAGKKPGSKNRATLLAEALREGEAEAMARIIIDRGMSGDGVALRFCLARLLAKPRGRTISLDLPQGTRPGDVVAAFNATLAAMAAGEITPEEALVVTRVLDGRRRALDAWQIEKKLTRYGATIPGDAVSAAHAPPHPTSDPLPRAGEGRVRACGDISGGAGAPMPSPRPSPAGGRGSDGIASGFACLPPRLQTACTTVALEAIEAEQLRRIAREALAAARAAA